MVDARWRFQYDTLRDLGVIRGRSPLESAWTDRFIEPPKP
jgi:hypothetical protein